MRRWMMWLMALSLMGNVFGQKKWDGGGSNGEWSNAQNWYPDGIPISTDSVVLDNSYLLGSYSISLPGGNVTTQVKALTIQPIVGVISVILPSANIGVPGFQVNGTGDVLVIADQGVFRNSSGASSGNALVVAGNIRINNGGKYIHQTARSNATVIDRLSTAVGTEKGIFEFDVPSTAGYTVSLSNNTFGTLVFRALSSNGNKSYSGSGSSNLTIRGDLIIDTGVQFTSTVIADIVVSGNIDIGGKFNLNPSTSGSSGRNLKLAGNNMCLKGIGSILMNANFRNIEIVRGATLLLQRNAQLINADNGFLNYGTLNTGNYFLWGEGKFVQQDSSILYLGSVAGLSKSRDSGNIRTAQQKFSKKAGYHFNGNALQVTGSSFPDTVATLGISNQAHCVIVSAISITDSMVLMKGNFITDSLHLLTFWGNKIRSSTNQWGETHGGWEESYIQGPLQIHIMDTSIVSIPIGKKYFAPLKIKKTIAGNYSYKFEFIESLPPVLTIDPNITVLKDSTYWTIKPDTGNLLRTLVLIGFKQASSNILTGTTVKPVVFNNKDSQPKWSMANARYTGNSTCGWFLLDSSNNDYQYLGYGYTQTLALLPINVPTLELQTFAEQINLSWKKIDKQQVNAYELQRSTNGKDFQCIYKIDVAKEKKEIYQWVDKRTDRGILYYRLKTILLDGANFSNIVATNPLKNAVPVIYPNPVNDKLKIFFPFPCSEYHLQIVNIRGFVILQTFVNTNYFEIGVNTLKSGIYFVRLFGNQRSFSLSFSKN